MVECIYCQGDGIYMGTLGTINYYQCRHCGIIFQLDITVRG